MRSCIRAAARGAVLFTLTTGLLAHASEVQAPGPAAAPFTIQTLSDQGWYFNLRELGVVSGDRALSVRVVQQPELWMAYSDGICLSLSPIDIDRVAPAHPKFVYDQMVYQVCDDTESCSPPRTISFDDRAGLTPSNPRTCVDEGEEPPVEENDLEHAAVTPNQRRVARAISRVCPFLSEGEFYLTHDQQDLRDLCQVLVDNPGDAYQALAAITPEEILTFGTIMVEMSNAQRKNIDARLQALRAGATGVSIDGLALQLEDGLVAGSMLPNIFGAGGVADPGFDRFGLFVSGNVEWGNQDASTREQGYDFATYGGTVGADYRVTDNFILGASYGFSSVNLDFHTSSGDLLATSHGVSVFGTYYAKDFYFDGFANWTWLDFDYRRRIQYSAGGSKVDRTAKADPDAWQLQLAGNLGYNFQADAWSIGPYAGATFLDGRIEGFTESGASGLNISFSRQTVDSLRTRMGLQISRAISTNYAVWSPEVRGEWLHEFLNDARSVNASFAAASSASSFSLRGNPPDRNFYRIGAGLSGQFAHGVAAFADWEYTIGLAQINQHSLQVGVRVEF
ncbi:MAG: autotransporter outer membrane beta-barrel domain-containing protein [Myxococcales bacterium]|nr:autotransporter outer membrane beta-barrel domain-containing protein [Myxococcales bacterium]